MVVRVLQVVGKLSLDVPRTGPVVVEADVPKFVVGQLKVEARGAEVKALKIVHVEVIAIFN